MDRLVDLCKVLSRFSTVMVVDNALNLDPNSFSDCSKVEIVIPPQNLGTLKAYNFVIDQHPEFDYFWFWNQDTSITDEVAKTFVDQSEVLFESNPKMIATTFFDARNWKNPLFKNRFLIKESTTLLNVVRMKKLGIGLFDENLFMDYGDWDLSHRIIKAGGKIVQIKGLSYIHFLGEPEKTILGKYYRSSESRLYMQGLNFIYLIRNRGFFTFIGMLLSFRFIILPFKNLLFDHSSRRNKMYFKGISDGIKGITSSNYISSLTSKY
jgi:GT2 family glycosyltransferase